MTEQQDVILLTGFGPFGEHTVNASWEVVQLVQSLNLAQQLNARLVIREIPVDYEAVNQLIPALWLEHRPLLTVHVGVSSLASGITIECRAHNEGYTKPDINDTTPCQACCSAADPAEHVISCGLDVRRIYQAVNKAGLGLTSQQSTFAGRYLCEYVYYRSLNIDKERTLFLHVPTLGKGLTAEQMARGVGVVLAEALKQIRGETSQQDS